MSNVENNIKNAKIECVERNRNWKANKSFSTKLGADPDSTDLLKSKLGQNAEDRHYGTFLHHL